MVSTVSNPRTIEAAATKAMVEESILAPRFYTTDFDKTARFDLSSQAQEFEAVLTEMRNDYNRHHFVRTDDFQQSWDHIQGKERQAFLDYLNAP